MNTQNLKGSSSIAKSTFRVKEALSLSEKQLATLLGINIQTLTKISIEQDIVESDTYESALLLISVYRSLYAKLGGSNPAMIHWLNSENSDFDGKPPLRIMATPDGIQKIIDYLEGFN